MQEGITKAKSIFLKSEQLREERAQLLKPLVPGAIHGEGSIFGIRTHNFNWLIIEPIGDRWAVSENGLTDVTGSPYFIVDTFEEIPAYVRSLELLGVIQGD